MWYSYDQNNTFGTFELGVMKFHIEAETPEQADLIAEQQGVYFDGCDNGHDCECCGDRWYRADGCTTQKERPEPADPVDLWGLREVWIPLTK